VGKYPPKNRPLYNRGHSLNKIAKDLYEGDAEFRDCVTTIAHKQIARRRKDYYAMSIMEPEDLEDEIWVDLFESDCASRESLESKAVDFVESLAKRGFRKRANTEEIPFSQLPVDENRDYENKVYSINSIDTE
jgi:hypothetical protein